MLRRTKIVATLGPATDDPVRLERMIRGGLDVARINFSHGTEAEQRRRVELLRRAAEKCGRDVGIIGDLQGPKIRIRRFRDGTVTLNDGDRFFLDPAMDGAAGTAEGVAVAYPDLHKDVKPGDMLLLDDGQITLNVERVDGTRIHTIVASGGPLSDNKGINRQGGGLSAPALSDKDCDDIRLAAELQLDFLAVSFVRSAHDVDQARRLLRAAGGEGLMVAKIERTEAVQAIDSIIEASDVIMVARGDLGVEVGYAELTGLQKQIIRRTRHKNRIVITATQMMESMVTHIIPTRAEVSDVANAVMDGTDAVMLSAETAVGEHPVTVIAAVSEICTGAEKYALTRGRTSHRLDDRFEAVDEAIAMAVMYTANHLPVKAIIALTESGNTTRWMSRIRSDIPIYAFTPHATTRRRVTLYRGVNPVPFKMVHDDLQQLYQDIFATLLSRNLVDVGDRVIFTKGDMEGVSGGTNAMKIVTVTAPA